MDTRCIVLKLIMDELGLVPGITSSKTLQEKMLLLSEHDIDLGYLFQVYGTKDNYVRRCKYLEQDYIDLIAQLEYEDTSWNDYVLKPFLRDKIRNIPKEQIYG